MHNDVCANCKFWKRGEGKYASWGRCSEIEYNGIEIVINGDATYDIDIDDDFSCILFNRREETPDSGKGA